MVVAKKIDGKIVDIDNDGDEVLASSEEGLQVVRHSCAHLLAQAMQNLYPRVQKAIGPATSNGFYYDFSNVHLGEDDLKKVEKEMKNIANKKLDIRREVLSKKEAISLFSNLGEEYKLKILDDIEEDFVTIYRQGEFVDLCRGPHVPNTSYLRAFKLISISGAYWKNDKNNEMLQRIYGYAFDTKERLNEYLNFIKEVEKRDHRKLGRELELFMSNSASFGSTFWLPNGMVLRKIVEEVTRQKHREKGYKEIKTPTIMNRELWQQSGHWDNYRENMYSTEFEDETLLVKPMNCPGSVLVYKNSPKSYRDLPIKLFELGNVFRRELSGTIHGLMRQREFTQDDAHIFLSQEMIEQEIIKVIKFVDEILSMFGFQYEVELSTRPEKYIGSIDIWEDATEALKRALEKSNTSYVVNEGDGSFYGPKIDYKVKDAMGRRWQCSTIQLDFNLPNRFELEYVDSNNEVQRPIMIHRAIYGSVERFIGILIEHYEGKLPLWLAPVQASIMTISEKSEKYAKEVYERLQDKGIRAFFDNSSDRVSQKIKRASLKKIPLHIILGEEERDNKELSVRTLSGENSKMTVEDLVNLITSSN